MSESEPTEVPQAPLVSVVIPAHNADATLDRCLTALSHGTVAPLETIVVCDGCEDRTEEVARSFSGVRVIRNDGRRGAGYSRNAGVAAARGDVLFFVDADCVPARDMIECGLRALADERAVFGSYGPETSAPGYWTRFKNYQHHFTHQNGEPYQASFWTGCGAITSEAFESVGGFDPSLTACEDIELGYALTRTGCRIRLVKDMHVEHLKRYSWSRLVRSDLIDRAAAWTRLVRVNRAGMGGLSTGRSARLSAILTAVFLVSAPLAPWSAWAAALAVAAPAGVASLNAGLLGFIRRRRGWRFACASAGALLMHYAMCGLGYAIGRVAPKLPRSRRAAEPAASPQQRARPASVAAVAKGS